LAELQGRRLLTVVGDGRLHHPLDAVAALDAKRGTLTFGLINYSPRQTISLKLKVSGKAVAPAAAWRIEGAALGDINLPGKPEAVTVVPLKETRSADQPLILPAHSITVVQVETKP
jgi:alpha-L-arabinofuranosidase